MFYRDMSNLPYVGNIADITLDNRAFTKVLYTGQQLQIVAMCLKPGEDSGQDTLQKQDVLIRVERGNAIVNLDGFEYILNDNMAIVVPVGSKYNIKNTSVDALLYMHIVYCLPHHPDHKITATKEEAIQERKTKVVTDFPTKKTVRH